MPNSDAASTSEEPILMYAAVTDIEAAAEAFIASLGRRNVEMLRSNLRSVEAQCDALVVLKAVLRRVG